MKNNYWEFYPKYIIALLNFIAMLSIYRKCPTGTRPQWDKGTKRQKGGNYEKHIWEILFR